MTNFLGAENVGIQGLVDQLSTVLMYVFAAVGAVSSIFAVYLGFMLAKAEDASKRKLAKKRIFNVLSGLFIIIILLTVMLSLELQFNNVGPTTPDPNITTELPEYTPPTPGSISYLSSYGVWETDTGGGTLPVGANFPEGEGGANDKNPKNYKISDYEKVLLARFIEAETKGHTKAVKIAVCEVIMRRVMSSQYDRNAKSVYAILSRQGEPYASSFNKAMNGSVLATSESSSVVREVLNGNSSNNSKGAYFYGDILQSPYNSKDSAWTIFKFPDNSSSQFIYFGDHTGSAGFILKDFRNV